MNMRKFYMSNWGQWEQIAVDGINDPNSPSLPVSMSFAMYLALANEMLANMTRAHA